jgi:hypothetical protein
MSRYVLLYSFLLGLFTGLFWLTISLSEYGQAQITVPEAAFVFAGFMAGMIFFERFGTAFSGKIYKAGILLGMISGLVGLFFPHALLFLSPVTGYIFYDFCQKAKKNPHPFRLVAAFLCGILLSQIWMYVSHYSDFPMMTLSSCIAGVLWMVPAWKLSGRQALPLWSSLEKSPHGTLSRFDWILTTFIIIVVLQWIFWHVILSHQLFDRNGAIQLWTVLGLMAIVWGMYPSDRKTNYSEGVYYMASILKVISLGMVYSSAIFWLFALLFVPGVYVILLKTTGYSLPQWKKTQTFGTIIMLALSWVVAGLYAHNHLDFVYDLKMDDDLALQSFIQAWTKEMTSVAAVVMVISGVRFLKPQWFARFDTGIIHSAPEE